MKYLTLLMLVLLSVSVFSAENTPQRIPSNLHIYNTNGAAYVDMDAHGCSGYRYYLSPGHPKYDAIVSILLAAQMSGKEVILRFDGCVNGSNPQGNIIGVFLR